MMVFPRPGILEGTEAHRPHRRWVHIRGSETDLRGVGGDAGTQPLLPLALAWARALHDDLPLTFGRTRIFEMAVLAARAEGVVDRGTRF